MNSISEMQTSTSEDIQDAFIELRWVMLSAQMQSGKTDTFNLVACEMLRNYMVDHVVVLCGATDKELKKQNTDRRPFIRKYRKYIRDMLCKENPDITPHDIVDSIDDIIDRIDDDSMFTYMWSSDIKRNHTRIFKNTLFIWDESHYAQSIGQLPALFLIHNGISGNGDVNSLKNMGNFMLSVSATNFSERANMALFDQPKREITLDVDDSYCGVEYMSNNNLIKYFKKTRDTLIDALESFEDKKLYAIVRYHTYNNGDIDFIKSRGYRVIEYNNKSLKDGTCCIKSLDELEVAPTVPTVIIIQNMCRMGKRVPKKYISFVMETSVDPNTDTFLQGLLGRMCGYHSRRDIIIYLHIRCSQIKKEIMSYIDNVIPIKAKNMKSGKEYFRYTVDEINNALRHSVSNKDEVFGLITKAIRSGDSSINLGNIVCGEKGMHISTKILKRIVSLCMDDGHFVSVVYAGYSKIEGFSYICGLKW
jgi:hypothetical protein